MDARRANKVWIFLCIEHGMLLFKYGLEVLINDVPKDVDIQLKRNDFLVSKVGGRESGIITNLKRDCLENLSRAASPRPSCTRLLPLPSGRPLRADYRGRCDMHPSIFIYRIVLSRSAVKSSGYSGDHHGGKG